MAKFQEVHFDGKTGLPVGWFEGENNCEVIRIDGNIATVKTEDGREMKVLICNNNKKV